MSASLSGLRVAVAGAGVLGLSSALAAARAGAQVVVFDPARLGDNASGVAAGMLSPALETALEGADAARFALFSQAYDAWPAFAASLGLPPAERDAGALQVGADKTITELADRLAALGASATAVAAAEVRARQPLYGGAYDGLFVAADGRLDPAATFAALAARLSDHGGRIVPRKLDPAERIEGFDRLVIAAGHDACAWAVAAPALASLIPIKGHILRFTVAEPRGATLRGTEGYLVPQAGGVAFGATMEPGQVDPAIDLAVAEGLRGRAVDLAPDLAGAAWIARAGVRAATPDGLPLVGVTGDAMILATGARRNGWLIAPLVVQAVLEALDGAAPRPAFAPLRFNPR